MLLSKHEIYRLTYFYGGSVDLFIESNEALNQIKLWKLWHLMVKPIKLPQISRQRTLVLLSFLLTARTTWKKVWFLKYLLRCHVLYYFHTLTAEESSRRMQVHFIPVEYKYILFTYNTSIFYSRRIQVDVIHVEYK